MTQEKPIEKNKPFTIRCGGIKANIWTNKVEKNGIEIEVQSVTFERTYKDGEVWKSTNSMRTTDLIKLELALQKVKEKVFEIKEA